MADINNNIASVTNIVTRSGDTFYQRFNVTDTSGDVELIMNNYAFEFTLSEGEDGSGPILSVGGDDVSNADIEVIGSSNISLLETDTKIIVGDGFFDIYIGKDAADGDNVYLDLDEGTYYYSVRATYDDNEEDVGDNEIRITKKVSKLWLYGEFEVLPDTIG